MNAVRSRLARPSHPIRVMDQDALITTLITVEAKLCVR